MKKLLILSGKGGTGKTTTSAAFIRFSQAKAFADCDVDAPNLHLVEALEGEPKRYVYAGSEKAHIDPRQCIGCSQCMMVCRFNAIRMNADGNKCEINEYACEGCGVCAYSCPMKAISMEEDIAGEQEVYTGERTFSTATLKMGRGNSGKLVSAVKLALYKHAPETELAIIDGSPGIGCPVISSISGVDQVLVVAEPSLSGLSDLERIVRTAASFEASTAVCVNKWDVSPEKTEAIEAFCRENGVPFVGRIPFDREASRAINDGRSLADVDCPASRALRQVYRSVMELMGLPEYAERV